MKNNISRKLALDSLRREKKNTLFILGVTIIAIVTICLTTILFSSYWEMEKQENIKQIGSWQYVVENCDSNLETEIVNHQETDYVAKVTMVGNMSYRDTKLAIGSMEDMDTLSHYGIQKGTYPKAGEVAISKKTLSLLGYTDTLGQTIALTYNDVNGNTVSENRILSGIVEDDVIELFYEKTSLTLKLKDFFFPTRENVEYPLPSIIISDANVDTHYMLFVKLKSSDMTLQSSILQQEDLQLESDMIYTIRNTLDEPYRIVFNPAYTVSAASNVFAGMFQFMIYAAALVITLTVVLGTTLSSLKVKEKEFALLRGLGQTKHQLRTMLFYETCFICLLAIPIGLGITAILTILGNIIFVNSMQMDVLKYYPNEIFYSVIAVVVIIFIATYIPAKKVSRRALSGTFDEEEFHRIQIRYRKLKKQTPRRLAFRELITSRTGTFAMIVILAFTFVSVTNVLDYQESYYSYEKIYQKAKEDKEVSFIVDDDIGDMTSGLSQEEVNDLNSITNQVGYTRQIDDRYMELYWSGIEKEQDLFYRLNLGVMTRYYYTGVAKNSIMSSHLDNAYMQDSVNQSLEGRLPETDNEVVVYLPYLKYESEFSKYFYGTVSARSKEDGDYNAHIDTISLGTTIETHSSFNVDDKDIKNSVEEYTVVGIIHETGNTYWMPVGAITMMFTDHKYNDIYNKIGTTSGTLEKQQEQPLYSSIYCKAGTALEKEELLMKLKAFQETHTDMKIIDKELEAKESLDVYQEEYYTSLMKATAISLISFFLYYYISRFKIVFTIKRIGLLKSIGASNKQIYKITLWKMGYCIIASLLLSQWTVAYGLMTKTPIQYYQYPFIMHILVTVILIVISLIVYCLPLRKILKKDVMENLQYRE